MSEIRGREEIEHELKQQNIGNARILGGLNGITTPRKTNVQHSRLDSRENVRPNDVDVRLNVGKHRH